MRVYAILSGKGGVGKTTVAINLAYAFSEIGKRTCLVDLNLTTPHVTTMLSFSHDKGVIDYLKGRANELESVYPYFKFWIMPSSLKLESLEDVNFDTLYNLRRDLGHFDYLLIDSAPGFGKEGLYPLSIADEIVLVANPTYSSLIDVLKAKQLAEALGKKIIGVIINKADHGSLTRQDFESAARLRVLGEIKFNKSFLKAEKLRLPASHVDSGVKEQFIEIAHTLLGLEYKKKGFFESFISKFFSWNKR